jgi:hypothetical protein
MGVSPMSQRNVNWVGLIVFVLGLAGSILVGASLPLIRDRLRVQYRLEVPSYYDGLPADTEANRERVIRLLEANDKLQADMEKPLPPAPVPEHGRTLNGTQGIIPLGRIFEPLYRLSNGPEYAQHACHFDWGWADGWLDLCRDVDKSVAAASHYENDVQTYWTIRLRPIRLQP